jgi:hypothetical protein
VKQNFVTHGNGPNPYKIEKKNMRVDLFGDTAVVTYIKEYRQTVDTTSDGNGGKLTAARKSQFERSDLVRVVE